MEQSRSKESAYALQTGASQFETKETMIKSKMFCAQNMKIIVIWGVIKWIVISLAALYLALALVQFSRAYRSSIRH